MLQTKTCCCGLRLKVGSFVIGVLSAVCSLGVLVCVEGVAWAWQGRSWTEGLRWAQTARAQGLPEDFVQTTLHFSFSELPFLSQGFRILLHLLGTVEAFNFNFSLMLVFGIWKERASWVRLWVLTSTASIALRIIFLVPISALVLREGFVVLGVSILMLTAVTIVLVAYFVIVVNNYHKQLISEKILRSFHSEWPDMK